VVSPVTSTRRSTSLSEKQDIARAVEGRHPQDFVAMLSYALTGAHVFIVLSGQRLGWSVAIPASSANLGRGSTLWEWP
jgi:hypothetical protein